MTTVALWSIRSTAMAYTNVPVNIDIRKCVQYIYSEFCTFVVLYKFCTYYPIITSKNLLALFESISQNASVNKNSSGQTISF